MKENSVKKNKSGKSLSLERTASLEAWKKENPSADTSMVATDSDEMALSQEDHAELAMNFAEHSLIS